jgi:hypothetical protein
MAFWVDFNKIEMNSKVSYAIFLICLLWVTSCRDNGNNDIAHSLDAVESLMDSNPDSAYKLLCRYDKSKLKTDRDSALFRLLWAEGRYKTFHDDTVENEIDRCVHFFQNSGESRNLMRALFYQGKIRQNLGMQGAAMVSFFESQESVDSADLLYRGKLHTALGELSGEMGDWPRQEEESRKAFECYKNLDSLVFIEDAKLWYATSLTQNNKIDQGIKLLKDLFVGSEERNDSDLYRKSACHLGNAYLWKKDYSNSKKYFSLLYNSRWTNDMELRDKKLLLLTMLEDNTPQDSVDALAWNIADNGGVVPFEYYQRIGDYRNAFNSLLNDYYELDAKYGRITKGDANFIVSNYQKGKIETTKKELALTKERNLWLIVAAGLLVVIVVLVSIYLLNKKSNKINELLALVALLSKNAESGEKKDQADDTGASFKVLKKIFNSLDALYSEYYKVSDGDKCRKGLLSRMGEEVEKLRSDDEMLKGFESEINKESDGLLESVYNGFERRLNADQRRMVVFLYLNMSADAICLLLDVNVAAMYNRKTRLIKRISESTSSRKEELLARISGH